MFTSFGEDQSTNSFHFPPGLRKKKEGDNCCSENSAGFAVLLFRVSARLAVVILSLRRVTAPSFRQFSGFVFRSSDQSNERERERETTISAVTENRSRSSLWMDTHTRRPRSGLESILFLPPSKVVPPQILILFEPERESAYCQFSPQERSWETAVEN